MYRYIGTTGTNAIGCGWAEGSATTRIVGDTDSQRFARHSTAQVGVGIKYGTERNGGTERIKLFRALGK